MKETDLDPDALGYMNNMRPMLPEIETIVKTDLRGVNAS
jgi:hypothetical protein